MTTTTTTDPADAELFAAWQQAERELDERERDVARLSIEREALVAAAGTHRDDVRASAPDAEQLTALDAMEDQLGTALTALRKAETRFFVLADRSWQLAMKGRGLRIAGLHQQVADLDAQEADAKRKIEQAQRDILTEQAKLLRLSVEKSGYLNQVQKLQPTSRPVRIDDVSRASRRPPRALLVKATAWAALIDQLRQDGVRGSIDVMVNEHDGTVRPQ